MTDEPREELISAYLDNELSADERAQVEKWLSEDAECRQLYEDLQALRGTLQSLPRHKLDHDLTPGVLRRAERTVLGTTEQTASAKAPPIPGDTFAGDISVGERWRQIWLRGGGWRRVVWPAIAVAAALMIAMFDTQREPVMRQVADTHGPRGEMAMKAAPAAAESGEGRDDKLADLESAPAAGLAKSAESKGPASTMSVRNTIESPAAAPTESAAAAKPAAGAVAGRGATQALGQAQLRQRAQNSRRLKAQAAALDQIPVAVESEVLPEFVEARGLERMLDERQIAWEHGDLAEQDSKQNRPDETPLAGTKVAVPQSPALASKDGDSPPAVELYVVEATPAQIKQIASDLVQDKRNVLRVTEPVNNEKLFYQMPKKAKEEDAAKIPLQQFKIVLRSAGQQLPSQSSTPSSPPAEKP